MEPTLLIGDEFTVRSLAGPPERGTVVVLAVVHGPDYSVEPAIGAGSKRDFEIKRVVAVDGDTVEVRDGRLVLNGSEVATSDPGREYQDSNGQHGHLLRERLGEHAYDVLRANGRPAAPRTIPAVVVPPGYVFVLGDNRDFSRDSRTFGAFPVEAVVGEVGIVYRSVDPSTHEERPGRAGIRIH